MCVKSCFSFFFVALQWKILFYEHWTNCLLSKWFSKVGQDLSWSRPIPLISISVGHIVRQLCMSFIVKNNTIRTLSNSHKLFVFRINSRMSLWMYQISNWNLIIWKYFIYIIKLLSKLQQELKVCWHFSIINY